MFDAGFLMKQAADTAGSYMARARAAIDESFGEGYAAAHPELVGAFMQAAAADFQAMWIGQRLEALEEAVRDVVADLPVSDEGMLEVKIFRG
jgi:hypothetical protein